MNDNPLENIGILFVKVILTALAAMLGIDLVLQFNIGVRNGLQNGIDNINKPNSGVVVGPKPTCGDPGPPVIGSTWWPVRGNPKTLKLIQNHYCADAFLTISNQTQVASFRSHSRAEKYAQELSYKTRSHFWVGPPSQY